MIPIHRTSAVRQALKPSNQPVAVFGAYGHTARFVVAELYQRGWMPILCGRDALKLTAFAKEHPKSDARVASVDDPASLDHALASASAVMNCAGPFVDTAAPIIEAALRAGIHYLDITAEQLPVLSALERFSDAARPAGVVIAPAMAFFGGLGDLLATAAMGDWVTADEILIATALDSWKPTRGTRLTGQRGGQHLTFSANRLESSAPRRAPEIFLPIRATRGRRPFTRRDHHDLTAYQSA